MSSSYHTHIAGDGLPAMVSAAVREGLDVLGVSEHVHPSRDQRPGFARAADRGPELDLRQYVTEVRYTAAPGMRIRLGLEIDFVPRTEALVRETCAPYPWDYLIGAVHEVDQTPLHTLAARNLTTAWVWWRRYCTLQEQAVRSGLFDILAHPLRLARYLTPPPYLVDLVGPVLDAAAACGVSVECNGADLGTHPQRAAALVAWCRDAGAGVTLGAGAHRPADVAQNLFQAGELLRLNGFVAVTGYAERRAVCEPLPTSTGGDRRQ